MSTPFIDPRSYTLPRACPASRVFIGVDLGQRRDHTAVAIIERNVTYSGSRNPVTMEWDRKITMDLRYLERLPLGTAYPDIVSHVVSLTRQPSLIGRAELIVDATGVGAPVIDLLRRAQHQAMLKAVMITGGDTTTRDRNYWRVPKRELIVGLQVALELGDLTIAEDVECANTFVTELRDMRVEISVNGNESFGAWRSGQHDDLVLAVSLAAWAARQA